MRFAPLFGAALWLGAALLFWVEPMMGRLFLPVLGGAPSVWNTCMVFFQTVLLGGYALASLLSRYPIRLQLSVLSVLALFGFLSLPPAISKEALASLPRQSTPVWWLLGELLRTIGLPFLFLSTLAPLLQKWFSLSRQEGAKDPYFLYAASNAGSLLALLSYPSLVERLFSLQRQTHLWRTVFLLEALLVLACGLLSRADGVAADKPERPAPASSKQFGVWAALAFIPSSLLLGVTTYLSTDIASIPLLWIVPLALYLLTFILAFARRQIVGANLLGRALAPLAIGLVFALLIGATEPAWLLILLHLAFFFVAGLLCHKRLAAARPDASQLTTYYLAISLGGMLGGLFNGLAAPLLFRGVTEYPLAILAACLALPALKAVDAGARAWDAALPCMIASATAGLIAIAPAFGAANDRAMRGLLFGLPLLGCYLMMERPVRFALSLAGVFLAAQLYTGGQGKLLHSERNFFGVLRVSSDPAGPFHKLFHGTTIHGLEFADAAQGCKPLSYYHPDGPLGDLFGGVKDQRAWTNVAAVGLGAGAVISYSKAGQNWSFYEIDPGVIRIANDTNYFNYLARCGGGLRKIIPGDARLELEEASDHTYDLMILDAFSSGMIPIHLITREALDLYLRKLAPNGVLAFHVSSRHLDLNPVLAELARSAGLVCFSRDDTGDPLAKREPGDYPSHWVTMARNRGAIPVIARRMRWSELLPTPGFKLWTDDYVDILGVFLWR